MSTLFGFLNTRYDQQVLIGGGSSGKVYRWRNRVTAQLVAIKVIYLGNSNDSSHRKKLLNELEIMDSILNCEYVARLYDRHYVNYQLAIVMEYCPGGTCKTLAKHFGGLNEWQMGLICRDVVLGLIELHQKDITHRDIKGDNLLLTMEGRVKLANFAK